jgi:thioesterase domain-containing protein
MPSAIETMAASYVQLLRTVQPHGPYRIGGFCSQAVVAWEMARQLQTAGEDVALLVLIEPPTLVRRVRWRTLYAGATLLAALSRGGPEARVSLMTAASMRWHGLTPMRSRDVGRLLRWLTGAASTLATRIDADRRREQISAIYGRAERGYLPRRFDGPVLCLQARDVPDRVSVREWRRLSRSFTERLIPGDHDSCIIAHSRSLAAELEPWLG